MKDLSREYLEEALQEARKWLPGWAWAHIRSAAMPRTGGRSRWREDEPSPIEKLALAEIKPRNLKAIDDDDLRAVWLRLDQWYGAAKKRWRPVEDIVNAASWTMAEMADRGFDVQPSPMVEDIEALRKDVGATGVMSRLAKLPRDVVVTPDFVSVVGSAAKGAVEPNDIDVCVRAAWKDGSLLVDENNISLPLRNVLDPEKQGIIHWIDNAQGPHGDHIPLYDLVMRRKDEMNKVIVKSDQIDAAIIPSHGPVGAPVAFVGASPGRVEAARGQPLTGPAGETFRNLYLKPLGLKYDDIAKLNAVPTLLTDDQGRTRQPTKDEAKERAKWLADELDRLKPKMVVALGKVARDALGDRADFVLPHPSAIRRFGDSGELARKLKKIKKSMPTAGDVHVDAPLGRGRQQQEIQQAEVDEEGGTRSKAATEHWDNHWHEMLPRSGKGRFVYQHHWMGLGEEDAKLDEKALLNTTHSLHGDLRLEGEDGLWGWAVFLGRAGDNRAAGGDKLIVLGEKKNLQLAPKLEQPEEWLKVGVGKPRTIKPGGPGAYADTWAKFFARDTGTYQLGTARKHGVEIFLDGRYLNGRYLIQFAPVAGQRIWLIDKPADQRPMAETRDLADIISELKRKRQKYLFWGKPGERPRKIDVTTGKVNASKEVPIAKADAAKQIVYGVVLDPYQVDAHGDWSPPGAVEDTAHEWMRKSRVVGIQHKGVAGRDTYPVESSLFPYPSKADYEKAMKGQAHRAYRMPYGDDVVHSGAWLVGTRLGDKEWRQYQDGEINAYSIGGWGHRTPIQRATMPDVTFVDLAPDQTPSRGK